jgi:hypothetical protein
MWHTTQIFPISQGCVRRLMSAIVWFLWRGALFLVPVSTLQRKNEERVGFVGCGSQMWSNNVHSAVIAASAGGLSGERAWQQYWGLRKYRAKPPPKLAIPQSLEYMPQYASGMVCVDPLNQGKGKKVYRQRIYDALRGMGVAGSTPRENANCNAICHGGMGPGMDWSPYDLGSDNIKATWFLVIHDLLPTNERLHRINLTETSRCKAYGAEDTRLHRLIECQRGKAVWDETRRRLILRTSPAGFRGHILVYGLPNDTERSCGYWIILCGSEREKERNLVGAGLYGLPPQTPMESGTASRKMETPG